MVVQSDLLNILFMVICCIIPFCLLLFIIAIMFARSIRARLKYAKEISENIDNPAHLEKLLPVPRRYLPIFVTVSWIVIGSQMCVIVITIAYYLNFPIINIIDANTLGLVGAFVLLASLIVTLIALIVMKAHSPKK